MKIKLKIVTPKRIVFEEEVAQVSLPTKMGEITILPGHVPLVGTLVAGAIEAKKEKSDKDDEIIPMAVSGGFLEFHENEITILADTAERADEIDLERAEEARKRAEELKKDKRKHLDEEQFATVVSNIEKQLSRIKVRKKYRPRKTI